MCFILATYSLNHRHCDVLLNQWKANPHGAGIASKERGEGKELVVEKGLMDKDAFKKALESRLGHITVAHLRNGTHGHIVPDDTHPFWTCQNNAVLFHNGILPSPFSSCKDVSDSRLMAKVLEDTPLMDVMAEKPQIERNIGQYNKLVFLSKTGMILILNERSGQYWPPHENTWISVGKMPKRYQRQFDFED